MDKKIFIESLYKAYKSAGYNTERGFGVMLAKRFGVTPPAVAEWLTPEKSYPKLSVLVEMALETGMSLDELILGRQPEEKAAPMIPILRMDEINTNEHELTEATARSMAGKHIFSPFGHADGLVGVIQAGDSMAPVYPDGATLIFDFNKKKPSSGKLILACLMDGSLLFRKLVQEGDRYLLPLNTTYQSYQGEFDAIGVLKFSIITSEQ